MVQEYCNDLGSGILWFISHISRSDNDATDVLTRMRSGGLNFTEFVLFCVVGINMGIGPDLLRLVSARPAGYCSGPRPD